MGRFQNPTKYWSYEGPFSVHLVRQELAAEFDGLPGFSVKDNVVSAGADPAYPGSIGQTIGGILCRCGEREFGIGYSHIIAFTKPDGSLIWQNRDYEGYPLGQAPALKQEETEEL